MKISELPEEVKELALLRQKEIPDDLETDNLTMAFNWYNTEEGSDYWNQWHVKKTVKEKPEHYDNSNGIKESDGKLMYELDFNFIESMSLRMAKNKGKYEPYNWQRPIDIEELKQSLFRHVMEVMQGNYKDDDDALGHLEAIAINAMIINYQIKNNG